MGQTFLRRSPLSYRVNHSALPAPRPARYVRYLRYLRYRYVCVCTMQPCTIQSSHSVHRVYLRVLLQRQLT
eukprot:scaffold32627_cov124-Isochrysis_galbana.AAC.2